ncbi:MAG: hypothetical protein DLM68_17775 [Hyphomicrobiales bacterium]|nr:MAG: hypothetical protein DLM68_17775 [Hyphomicrobiales bacterium]
MRITVDRDEAAAAVPHFRDRRIPHPAQSRNTIDFGQSRAEAHGHINYWPRECSVLQVRKVWSGSCHKIGCSTISRVL